MRRSFYLILFIFAFIIHTNSQSIIQKIKSEYAYLDSTSYFVNALTKNSTEVFPGYSKGFGFSKDYVDNAKDELKSKKVVFVLNIEIDTAKLNTNSFIILDSCIYKFNVYTFDKKFHRLIKYFNFKDNENYPYFSPTSGTIYQRYLMDGCRKILKRKPDYLLNCYHSYLGIFYVSESKIYVYNIQTKRTYELADYVKKFKNSPLFYCRGTVQPDR